MAKQRWLGQLLSAVPVLARTKEAAGSDCLALHRSAATLHILTHFESQKVFNAL